MSERAPKPIPIPLEPFQAKEGYSRLAQSTSNKIQELEHSGDKLVREEPFINNSIDDSISHYRGMKKMFEDMRDSYGVNVPDIDIVIGNSKKGEKRVFMLVDKINGQPLDEFKNVPLEEKEKLERLFIGALQSMFDAYKKREPFFSDLKLANIMYGRKSKEKNTEKDFFLFDVGYGSFRDPNDKEHEQHGLPTYDKLFANIIENSPMHLAMMEEVFKTPVTLEKVRQKITEIGEYLKTSKIV